jgi:hypothetical protein
MERELGVFIEKGEERAPAVFQMPLMASTIFKTIDTSVSRREIIGGGRNRRVDAPLTARNERTRGASGSRRARTSGCTVGWRGSTGALGRLA